MRLLSPLLPLVCALGVLTACDAGNDVDDPRAEPDSTARLETGRAVYQQHCASCHGERLQGQPDWRRRLPNGRLPAPPHDDSGHTWHHPDAMLFAMVRDGLVPPLAPPDYESDMPAFRGRLGDEQIWAVLAWIKSHWSPAVRAERQKIGR